MDRLRDRQTDRRTVREKQREGEREHGPSRNDLTQMPDDDELMLNVLRCHLTY